jgi:uncharacterized membrane protein
VALQKKPGRLKALSWLGVGLVVSVGVGFCVGVFQRDLSLGLTIGGTCLTILTAIQGILIAFLHR